MSHSGHTHHKYSLVVYLLLANGITWLGWIPGLWIGGQQGYVMPNFNTYATLFESGFVNRQHQMLGLAFSLGVYGPLIGGLVATWMDGGRAGLADLWQRVIHWRIGARWYLTTIGIAVLLTGIPVGITAFMAGSNPASMTLGFVLFVFLAQILTSGLGEEPGWRGYLLPRLQTRFTAVKCIWLLGLVWAVWHYPIVIMQTLNGMENVAPLQTVITIFIGLAVQTMSLIGITYLYVWLYNHTGSIFLCILFHASSNVFSFWLVSFIKEPQSIMIFVALMPWLLVVVLRLLSGKNNFPGQAQMSAQ